MAAVTVTSKDTLMPWFILTTLAQDLTLHGREKEGESHFLCP